MNVVNHARFKSQFLPLFLIILSLILINTSLRTNLTQVDNVSSRDLPYLESFDETFADLFHSIGGNWSLDNGTYTQFSRTGYDLGTLVPIDIEANRSYTLSVDIKTIFGNAGGGLLFNAQNSQSRQLSHMVRFNVDADALYLIFGYFGETSDFIGQGSVRLDIPIDTPDWQVVGVYVTENTYDVLLDDKIVARDLPLVYRGGAFGLVASASHVTFDNLQANYVTLDNRIIEDEEVFGLVAPTNISGSVKRVDDNFIGTQDNLWRPFSGEWDVRNGVLNQLQSTGFDHGIGFDQSFTRPLSVKSTIQHLQGRGGGLLFNMTQPDAKTQSHIVRFVPDAEFLVWGYFNDEGVFFAQGSIPISLAESDADTLAVRVDDTAYAIVLNEQTIVDGIPIVYSGDYIGLVTAQSIAKFSDTMVSSASEITIDQSPSQMPLTYDTYNLNVVSGNWQFGDVIKQNATEATDYVAGTGVAAERFTVNVDISLPQDDTEAGAGIVFHMTGRDNVAMGQMVRFGAGGSEIFWGSYNAQSVFKGAGGKPLTLDWSQPHQLTIVVRVDNYDILIDQNTIVQDLPLRADFGWIGLVSYRGTTTFENFELQLGGT